MTIRDPGRSHPHAFGAHPRRPTVTGRPRASNMHVVVQNEPDCSDGTESRALTSPQSTATRIPWQVGDSCLQHATLRFGLFSFSCPRLRYVRPTEAIVGPTAPCDRTHGPYRYARSAPCFAPQGPAGTGKVAGRDRAPSESANVSKLKRPSARRWPAMRGVGLEWPVPGGGRRVASARHGQSSYNRPTVTARRDRIYRHRAARRRLTGTRPRRTCDTRQRQSRVATRGITPRPRTARRDAAGRVAPGTAHAARLSPCSNTLAFGHGTPRIRFASSPRIRHDHARPCPP